MYTETSVFVGPQDAALELLAWMEDFAHLQAGWMIVTLAELDDPAEDARVQGQVSALAAAGLTFAVLVCHVQCDDETDLPHQAAATLGMRKLVLRGWEDATSRKGRPTRVEVHLADDEQLRVLGDLVLVRNFPFRLNAWRPLHTVHGHGERDGAYERVHGIWPTAKRR